MPLRIRCFDQAYLPITLPVLQLLLALDGTDYRLSVFIPDQVMYAIALSEAVDCISLMLIDPFDQIFCDANINGAIACARHDVDERHGSSRKLWIPAYAGMTILELAAMSHQFDSFEALHSGPGLRRDDDFGACCNVTSV